MDAEGDPSGHGRARLHDMDELRGDVQVSRSVLRVAMSRPGGHDSLTVLVLADRADVALTACHALASRGHHVGAASSSRSSPALTSRAITYRHLFPSRDAPQSTWDMALDSALSERAYDVVLACNDIDVARLTASPSAVARVPSISAAQEVVHDKAALAQVCADVGVNYPPTLVGDACLGDAALGLAARGRAVVKAARPAAMTSRGIVHMPGMNAPRDHRELRSVIDHYRSVGLEPVVQQFVEGPKIQASLIRRNGVTTCRLVALVVRGTPAEATLRQLDSSRGVGAECIAALELVSDRAGYQGLLQAEFVVESSGRPCLIDANPRLWGGLSFAELIGLRMTERAVRDAVGLPPTPMPAEFAGRTYHHLARELTHVARSPRELPSLVSQWSRHDVWDVPRIDDLRPLAVRSWHKLRSSAWLRGRGRRGLPDASAD